MNKILIISTGGTFNKQYNPLTGNLDINSDADAIKNILSSIKVTNYQLKTIIHKDSLDITKKDRKKLLKLILASKYNKIIIIHGTDTIDQTASFLDKHIKNKTIILTGAMIPFSINPIEATANFSFACGYLLQKTKSGILISMHGHIKNYQKITKNRDQGIFEIS